MSWAPANMATGRMEGTHVGYSGTSRGMTDNQLNRLRDLMTEIKSRTTGPHWLHHGDCVGGDAQAHRIARQLSFYIYLHPPLVQTHRAFCDWDQRDPAMDFLVRDDEITRWSHGGLIAAPRQATEVLRSGTWTTVRYALKRGRSVTVIAPSGERSVL